VEQHVIDDAARRMLRLIVRSGALDRAPVDPLVRRDSGSAANRGAAAKVAEEAIVLLRNERDLLPLDRAKVKRLAVIGPNADVPLQQGGGSAAVVPAALVTPLSALTSLLGGDGVGKDVAVTYARGVDNDLTPPPADVRMLSADASRREPGLRYRYWRGDTMSGTPAYSGIENYFDKTMFAAELMQMSARWEGWFWPTSDGEHEFLLATLGGGRLFVDGREVIGPKAGTALPVESDFQAAGRTAKLALRKGRGYAIRIEFTSPPVSFHQMHFGVRLPAPDLQEAVQAARQADAAVVFVGVSRTSESEGRDRTTMALVGRQDELVEAVLAANPNTIVVLNNGAPLDFPWADRVPSLVEAWLPGQEGAGAIARVLFGEVNPSGRLPFTFPRRLEDNPTFLSYSGGRDANYGEGVFIGYRYYDTKKVAPLFAFGHGLSYTRFEYSKLVVPQSADGAFDVSVDVRNAGTRAGSEVVQVYLGDAATTEVRRPLKELKAFAKVSLAPGESRTVRFAVTPRDLAYYDVHVGDWVTTPGMHRVDVGGGSADIRQSAPLRWTGPRDPRLPDAGRAGFNEGF
jgi:beta-glucosidase